jgi:DNA-binding FadR family transcriptional regulator
MLVRPAKRRSASSPSTVYERLVQMISDRRVGEIPGNTDEPLGAVRKCLVNNPGKVEADLEDHSRILGAVRRRDPDEAERTMRRHIRAMRSARLGALR